MYRPLLRLSDPLAKLSEIYTSRKDKYEQADVIVPITNNMNTYDVSIAVVKAILLFISQNPPKWVEWKRKRDSIAVEAAARVCIIIV